MARILLNDGWLLHDFPLDFGADRLAGVLREPEGWLPCSVPCDVTVPLIAAGRALEPTVADQAEQNRWIERRSWWFQKTFWSDDLPGWKEAESVELCFRSLDLIADVFLNGVWLGSHRSCHFPFRHEVGKLIAEGRNVIAVRLTVGLETVSDRDLAEIDWAVCTEDGRSVDARGDMRRAFLRKPQYVFGWDWSPRAATCGIVDDVFLDVHRAAAIRGLSVHTVSADAREAVVCGELEIENLSATRTRDADVILDVSFGNMPITTVRLEDQLLCSGINYIPFEIRLRSPKLWWPNGMGEQALYSLDVLVSCEGRSIVHPTVRFGVRTVELDCGRMDETHRRFAFRVNGVEIFMKGGDWVPPDPLYARVSDEKLETLVREAANANFNALRVWGGGIYNRDRFYDLCDEYGLLLWHDFMFACAAYPDHLEWFRDLCEKELDYQTRRLRCHPCMALFCGNNEDHEIFNWETGCGFPLRGAPDRQYGLYVSNVLARRAVRQNCPYIPYWNSSPYGGAIPQSQDVGDVHYWGDAMMNPEMERRIDPFVYDQVDARFVSEYGYIGPAPLASVREYMGGRPLDPDSRVWKMHTNTFEANTVRAGICKHYTERSISLDEYLLYAGLVQGTLLGYSIEAFRAKTGCAGGIFWMYDDCWGEIGWTIVDYYLRRKIAYYAVRRAFEPVRLILRQEDGHISILGANETGRSLEVRAEVGVVSFDGKRRDTRIVQFPLPARSREVVGTLTVPEYDPALACVAVIPLDRSIQPATLRVLDARQLRLAGGAEITADERVGADRRLTVCAKTYTHAVWVDTDLPCSDNYFDLLPGEERTVTVFGAQDVPLSLRWVF